MEYKKGTRLKKGTEIGFVCDYLKNEIYPITVIWNNDDKYVYKYDKKYLADNHIEIISKEEYKKLS